MLSLGSVSSFRLFVFRVVKHRELSVSQDSDVGVGRILAWQEEHFGRSDYVLTAKGGSMKCFS